MYINVRITKEEVIPIYWLERWRKLKMRNFLFILTLFLTTATITSAYAQNATSATMGVYYDRETGLYYDIPLQGGYCLDFNEDKICDVDFHDGKVVVYGPDVVTKQTSINAMAQLDERQKEMIREINNNDDDNNNNDNDNDNDNDDDDNDSNSDLDVIATKMVMIVNHKTISVIMTKAANQKALTA
jgi:hypothetical protein